MYERLRAKSEDGRLTVSVISLYELEKGARLSRNPGKDLALVRALISELEILELDAKAADISSELYSSLGKKGKLIGEFDIMIAASCIAHDEPLLTDDSDFDSLPNLTKLQYQNS